MAFVGIWAGSRAVRASRPQRCGRVRMTAVEGSGSGASTSDAEDVWRLYKMFDYYKAWDWNTYDRTKGWILLCGPERALWENNLLEAGITPAHEVYSRFMPDVEIEYQTKQKLATVHVLLFGKGDTKSIMTLNNEGEKIVLAFEASDDAQGYAIQAEALGFPLMSVEKVDADLVVDYAKQNAMYRAIIPAGTVIAPPSNTRRP